MPRTISERLLTALLYRLGVVRTLEAAWRQDLQRAEARSADRVAKAAATVKEIEARLGRLLDEHAQLTRRTRDLEQVIADDRRHTARLCTFTNAVDSGTLARHVSAAIDRARLVDDPAPMLILERVFPDDIYETILAAIPPREAFRVKDRTKADYRARKPAMIVPELSDAVWRHLDERLVPDTMAPALARRFEGFAAEYYRCLLGSDIGKRALRLPIEATAARLMLRRPGYHLDPHLDPKRVLLTLLIYLARPGDSETFGTGFYRVDGDVARDHATTYYPQQAGHRCELVRVVPFRPNTGVAFLNAAAHGVDLPADLPPDLERFSWQVYLGPRVDALTQLLRELPEPARQSWAGLLA